MADGVARGLLPGDLRAVVAVATDAARDARRRHRLAPTSAALLAQGLAGGALLASLQKGDSRVNLQVECDGPLRGFFVDAGANGEVRGYVKNPHVDLELGEGEFRWRGAMGNDGFLSVLRDIGAEYYRSSVQLRAMDLAKDLDHYFEVSDQVPTHVALTLRRLPEEPLGVVAGALVQALPEGDRQALEAVGRSLQASLDAAVAAADAPTPEGLFSALFSAGQALTAYPVRFVCTCSKARALETLKSLGAADVQRIVDTLGSTAVTCHFCGAKHEITLPDLLRILEDLGAGAPKD
ncbi:MAG: Hsp33 family molecular chaperone HslO [Myxococcota bacterium]|jgi:molecular chaperone Hsp33